MIRYTDRAKDDVKFAFQWYERQRRGLGFDFLDCVEMSLNNIQHHPEMYEKIHSDFRRCITRKFPFSVIYMTECEDIVIHAVFDNRQDPEKLP